MANKARDFRNNAQLKWPGASVLRRGRTWIEHIHPSDPSRVMLDASVGSIHYGASSDLEIDTAWETSVDAAWQWQMVKSDYNTYARNILNAGDTVKYIHSESGEYIIFQPLALNWVDNATDSRQQITQPQAISASPVDDLLRWENGYGTGIHFSWQTQASRLQKLITVDSAANLPAPTVANPYLEIEFIIKKATFTSNQMKVKIIWLETVNNRSNFTNSSILEFNDGN